MVAIEIASSEPRLEDFEHCDTNYDTNANISQKSLESSPERGIIRKDSDVIKRRISSNRKISQLSTPSSARSLDNGMSIWKTKPGFRNDIDDFQCIELRKTLIRKNLRFYATLLFVLAVSATALTIIDTQVSVNLQEQNRYVEGALYNFSKFNLSQHILQKEKDKVRVYTIVEIGMKSLISVLSVTTCIALYFYYRNIYQLKVIRNFYPPTMSFMRTTPLFKYYLLECIICIFHVPPLLTTHAGFPPRLQLVVLLRLYLLGRYLKEKHELMNSQSTRFLASVTKTELTSIFLFKTFFMQYPFQLILLAYIILLFIGGYTVWILEERYTYLDTVWMLIITMTTVGFGDLTPKTVPGRFAVGLAAIVGIFLMALFISLVNEALMLQRREKRILSYVENQDHARHRKIAAINAIGMWFKYHSFVKKYFPTFDLTSEPLIGRRELGRKRDWYVVVKKKYMENQMFKAINEWRKMKESQVSGYFAQEFMIEDMKNMMTDLHSKVDDLEVKLTRMMGSTSMDTIPEYKLSRSPSKQRSGRKSREITSPSNSHDKVYHNSERKPSKDTTESSIELKELHSPPSYIFSNKQLKPHRNGEEPRFYITSDYGKDNDKTKGLRELLAEKKNEENKFALGNTELQIAFKLLQDQAKIMNNSLDDVYSKTKQDINDLQNLISSLLICDDEESKLDHKANAELKV